MYGIVFYLNKQKLIENYGNNYQDAYEEIRSSLRHYGFHWLSNSFYFSQTLNSLSRVFEAIKAIKEFSWFVNSLVTLHVFKIDDLSDFTEYVQNLKQKIKMEEEDFETEIEAGKTKKPNK